MDELGEVWLRINKNEVVRLFACPTCGGIPFEASAPPCKCHSVDTLTQTTDACIRFDSRMKEFNIAFGNSELILIRFCFVCGGGMPPSIRGTYFVSVPEEELIRLETKLRNVNSLIAVRQALGEPDLIKNCAYDADLPGDPISEAWFYNRCSETVKIVIQERIAGGGIQIAFGAKEKPRES